MIQRPRFVASRALGRLIATLAVLLSPLAANAAVIINVTEVGGDVIFATTGNLDLTGATFLNTAGYEDGFIPGGSNWYIASGVGTSVDLYALTSFDGPFGTSTTFFTPPSSTSGDDFVIWGNEGNIEQVGVPVGYISGSAIASGMVFSGATIAGFTMIPGTYVYTLPNDTITLNIGVPDEPTNSDSPFRVSPSIWVYHSRDGDGGYDFTTTLPIGTHNLGIWATGGADSSAEEGPLCVTSAEPPTGDEVCALDMQFQLSGDGALLSFTPAVGLSATESFVEADGTLLRANLTSADAPLLAGFPPQEVGVLSLEVTGGSVLVSVTGVEGIGADGDTLPVATNVLFIPEPSEYLLLASGIGMLALLGRYRRVRTR